MVKIGEERLGSVQFATPSPFEPDEEPARERAEENIKSPFPTEEGTTWDRFLNIILMDAEIQNEIIGDIIDDRFVDTATRYQLGMLGDYWGLERREDETDDHFRARIKTQLPRHTAMTTINDIVRTAAQLLDTDKSRIDVEESFEVEPARFDLLVEELAFMNTDVTVEEFEELIQHIKAAGVRVHATIGDQFTYRSADDYDEGVNNIDKGYGGIDTYQLEENEDEPDQLLHGEFHPGVVMDYVGGVYADEVTAQL